VHIIEIPVIRTKSRHAHTHTQTRSTHTNTYAGGMPRRKTNNTSRPQKTRKTTSL